MLQDNGFMHIDYLEQDWWNLLSEIKSCFLSMGEVSLSQWEKTLRIP